MKDCRHTGETCENTNTKGVNTQNDKCLNRQSGNVNLNSMLQTISNKLNLCYFITYK